MLRTPTIEMHMVTIVCSSICEWLDILNCDVVKLFDDSFFCKSTYIHTTYQFRSSNELLLPLLKYMHFCTSNITLSTLVVNLSGTVHEKEINVPYRVNF